MYDSARWRSLRRRLLDKWRAEHGPTCPGDEHHAEHVSFDLTLDHVVPLERGGAPYDERNLRVLCRSFNASKRDR